MRMECSADMSSARQKRTTPSSPPDKSTLCSRRQNTAVTFPLCACGMTRVSRCPSNTYSCPFCVPTTVTSPPVNVLV